jgi:mRNA interferase RelE/StbE
MKRPVRPAAQVIEFAKLLAPEQRRAIKRALRDLGDEVDCDIKPLEGTLIGYHRLRVGRFRIVFSYARDGAVEAIFAEERSVVYELFEAEFVKKLKK